MEMEIPPYKYRIISCLGCGAYGRVAMALDFSGGIIVAIKTSSHIGIAFEESKILNFLSPSQYVVQILGQGNAEIVEGCLLKETSNNDYHHASPGIHANEIAYIAMEFMDMDLQSFIKKIMHGEYAFKNCYVSSNNKPKLVRWLMWELCNGLAYCHDKGVAHRDLKPSNCLLSINKGGVITIKLADFGLAAMVKDKKNGLLQRNQTEYVSLWYRAPELLMQQRSYNCFAIDVWALGCIFAEMVIGEPIFCGHSPEEQLNIVFEHVGGSSIEMIDKYWDALSDISYVTTLAQLLTRPRLSNFGSWNRFESIAQKMEYLAGIDLLLKMLEVEPNKRLTAKECLKHPYFSCFQSS